MKHLYLIPALVIAWTSAAGAAPTVSMKATGARPGQLGEVSLYLNADSQSVTAAQFVVDVSTATRGQAEFEVSAVQSAPGWEPAVAWVRSATRDRLCITLTNNQNNGQGISTSGPIVTFKLMQVKTGWMNTDLSLVNGNANTATGSLLLRNDPTNGQEEFLPITYVTGKFLSGARRKLEGTANNAVSVGSDGVARFIAACAGNSLHLLDAFTPDLAPVLDFHGPKDLGSTVTGRPVFYYEGTDLCVAVGTTGGRLVSYKVATGETVFDLHLSTLNISGSIPNCPAVTDYAARTLYWPVQTSTGPAIVRQNGTNLYLTRFGTTGATVSASPTVVTDRLMIGTSTGLYSFRVNADGSLGTPVLMASDNFNTYVATGRSGSVVGPREALASTTTNKVYKINIPVARIVGDPLSVPPDSTPCCDPYFNWATNEMVYGGNDGAVYRIRLNVTGMMPSMGPTADFSTSPITAVFPYNGSTYAGDTAGNFGRIGAGTDQVNVGTRIGKAVCAAIIGDPRQDAIITSTIDGDVIAMPPFTDASTYLKATPAVSAN